jgi:hypothetical protein
VACAHRSRSRSRPAWAPGARVACLGAPRRARGRRDLAGPGQWPSRARDSIPSLDTTNGSGLVTPAAQPRRVPPHAGTPATRSTGNGMQHPSRMLPTHLRISLQHAGAAHGVPERACPALRRSVYEHHPGGEARPCPCARVSQSVSVSLISAVCVARVTDGVERKGGLSGRQRGRPPHRSTRQRNRIGVIFLFPFPSLARKCHVPVAGAPKCVKTMGYLFIYSLLSRLM